MNEQQITNLSVNVLRVHPKNQEFFDDIDGEQYDKFKKSIKEEGVITPLIVASDMTIISGHQRLKACKDLDIGLIPVIIRDDLIDEDAKLKKLLATNFGRLKNNPVKQGRVYEEYEKLCGVRQGSAGNSEPKISGRVTQADIAKELGVSVDTILNFKKLSKLSPELQELIQDGTVKYTTALNVWGKLPQEEQSKLIKELGKDYISSLSKKETEKFLGQLEQLKDRVAEFEAKESYNESEADEYKKLKTQIANLKRNKNDLNRQIISATELSGLVVRVEHFLKNELAPVRYTRAIHEQQQDKIVQRNLKDIVRRVQGWCDEMNELLVDNNYIDAEVIVYE
jgi:ParB family transcriptional regulator, chromosome partitioning protein